MTKDKDQADILAYMAEVYGPIQTKRCSLGTLVKKPHNRYSLILRRDVHARRQAKATRGMGIPRVVDVGPLTWEDAEIIDARERASAMVAI